MRAFHSILTTTVVAAVLMPAFAGSAAGQEEKAANAQQPSDRSANAASKKNRSNENSRKSQADDRGRTPNGERIERTLTQEVNVEFVGETLKTAVEYWEQLYGVPMRIKEGALEAEGISSEEEFTLLLSGVTLGDAFAIILPTEIGGLDYYVEGGVLWITTQEDAAKHRSTSTYDVPDGIEASDAARMMIEHRLTSPRGDVTFGENGSITAVGDSLVVTHSHRGHEAVRKFLKAIADAEGPVSFVTSPTPPTHSPRDPRTPQQQFAPRR